MRFSWVLYAVFTLAVLFLISGCDSNPREEALSDSSDSLITVIDGLGREVVVPFNPEHVICSGPGCLRLLVYIQAQDRVVAVDDMEGRRPDFDARPYAIANKWLCELPVFGEFRGHDNPELILALDPQPQVIFKTYPMMGMDPMELQDKTGIPVVVLEYGTLNSQPDELYRSLRTIGVVMGESERAEAVVEFIEETMTDLQNRTADITVEERKSCYVGGIAYRGPHGFQSTEPAYPPFMLVSADNVALRSSSEEEPDEHADMAKEQILVWDPEVIFVDASTMETDPQASALYQLRTDPAYSSLSAVQSGEVYCVLPYNWYTANFGSILADSYFIGKVLYPDRFTDIDPAARADEIYRYLVGDAVFQELDAAFNSMIFSRIPL